MHSSQTEVLKEIKDIQEQLEQIIVGYQGENDPYFTAVQNRLDDLDKTEDGREKDDNDI